MNPVRPVVLGRETGDGVELVTLHLFPGGRVYLAALADQSDRVLEWFELWVQCAHELESSLLTRVAVIGNALHDKQWLNAVDAIRDFDGEHFIETKWETNASTPLVVDLRRMAVVRLVHATSGIPFELCRDDSLLKAAQLGAYSSTLERWFFAKAPTGELAWLSVHDLLGRESAEKIAIPETGSDAPTTDFNAGAGLMLLRKHHPVGTEAFLTWLDHIARSEAALPEQNDSSPIERDMLTGWGRLLQGASHGDPVTENAYLRLQFWHAMVAEVHRLSTRLEVPFLNLTPDSFRVSLCTPSTQSAPMCPFRPVLVHPADAVPIRLGERNAGFAPLRGTLNSPYALPKFGAWLDGSGTLRVRQAIAAGGGHTRLEGVLESKELRSVAPGNFVWVQTRVDGHSISFFATIENDTGGARAGVPFSAPAVELPPNADTRLKAMPRHPCQFVVLQPVHPVFDVYSLGVIGVRIFLAQDSQSVNELVDDLLELAAVLPQGETVDDLHQLAEAKELSDRLRALLKPPAWARNTSGDTVLAENVWLAILRELIEFTAIEIPADSESTSLNGTDWVGPLTERLASVENLAAQVGRLISCPRADHDEVARVVHSFV